MILQNIHRRVGAISYVNIKASRWLPFAILAAVGMAVPPGEKPNFTGVWKLTTVSRDGLALSARENTFAETQVANEAPRLQCPGRNRGLIISSHSQSSIHYIARWS